ncbi:TPA: hypothetical protein ACNH47_001657 [Pseudomonas aeruginosa]
MEFTAHAIQRCSQRGIRVRQVEWLVTFGCHTWNRGARVCFFDRARFQRLLLSLEPTERQLAEKTRGSYAVVSDGRVVTVGHREAAFCASKPGSHRSRHGQIHVA